MWHSHELSRRKIMTEIEVVHCNLLSSVVVGFSWGFCISTPYNFSLFRHQFIIFTLCLSFCCIATLPKFTQNTDGKVAFYLDFVKVEQVARRLEEVYKTESFTF